MRIVNQELQYEKAALIEPNNKGYIHIAAEVDGKPLPLKPKSKVKKTLIQKAKATLKRLEDHPSVSAAHMLSAIVFPPGIREEAAFIRKLKKVPRRARFDLAVHIETTNPHEAVLLSENPLYQELESLIRESAVNTHKR